VTGTRSTTTDIFGSRLPRLVGVLYLILAVCGLTSQLSARVGTAVVLDPSASADHIRAATGWFQIGLAADGLYMAGFVVLSLALYALFATSSPRIAAALLVFGAVAVAMMGVSLLNRAGAYAIATDATTAAALGARGVDALAGVYLDLHRHGRLIAQLFVGMWLLSLGYVVQHSGYVPRVLGMLLLLGGIGYLGDVVGFFLTPGFESSLTPYLVMPAGLAEVSFLLWLLVKGATRPPKAAQTPHSAWGHSLATHTPEGAQHGLVR
jgi:hypothetical protein